MDQLRFALTDESPQVRAAVARALGRQGGRPAVEALLIALQDEEPVVVGAAAEAVGEVGGPEDAIHLLPLVGEAADPAPAPAAWAAVRALGRLGAPDLATALGRAASHPEGEVVKEVAEVAADLEGEAGARILLACARHPAWDVRRAAARLLARRGRSRRSSPISRPSSRARPIPSPPRGSGRRSPAWVRSDGCCRVRPGSR